MPYKSIKHLYGKIFELYDTGMSGKEIAEILGFKHSNSVRQILKSNNKIRTQSEASKLAVTQGKKDKAIGLLIESAKTDNRFNPLKIVKGERSGRWIKDRTKIKQKRMFTEEKHFFKSLIKERGFTCEITKQKGALSVHHLDGVWMSPEKIFDKINCIVILKHIHLKFHKMYGHRTDKNDWDEFIHKKEYVDDYVMRIKKRYVPFEDRTGKRYGRLLVVKKINKKWECICDCGNTKLVTANNFKSTKSCGCLKIESDKTRIYINKPWLKSPRSNKKIRLLTA